MTVTGSGFTKITKVAFGTADGTAVKVLSAATLTVTAPAGSAVCGAVLVSPWTGKNGTSPTAFGSANCDGSTPAPDQQLDTATQQFSEDLDGVQVQCGDGYQSLCAEAQTALTCLSAAEGVAEANSPIPLTNEQTAEAFASEAGGWSIDRSHSYPDQPLRLWTAELRRTACLTVTGSCTA